MRRQGGLGLGLTIVRELMTLHGGTVTAESPGPQQGTTVRLEFAVAEVSHEPGEAPSQGLGSQAPVH